MSALRHILCVDDNNDSGELISFMLRQSNENYSVTRVKTAEHALEAVKKQLFDLFILDYKLPGTTGVEVCRSLRQKGFNSPIMFFTGMAYPDDRKAAMEAGANEYLVKPNDFERLPQTVEKLLSSNPYEYDNETANAAKVYKGIY